MVTVIEFLSRLLGSVVDLVVIFLTDVFLNDPVGAVVFLVGAGLTTASVAAFGALVLGAALDAVGIDVGSPGRTPSRPAEPRE
jgi:hypothetical protein